MDLFDTSRFLVRNATGAWTPFLQTTYIVCNAIIVIAYIMIPMLFINVWRKKRTDYRSSWMIVLFSLFILSCGLTHVTNILTFWWAPYRFYVLIYFITAIISIITMITLPIVVGRKLRLLSREQYHEMVNRLQVLITEKEVAITQKNNLIESLEDQIHELERIKNRGVWVAEQEFMLQKIKNVLKNEGNNGS